MGKIKLLLYVLFLSASTLYPSKEKFITYTIHFTYENPTKSTSPAHIFACIILSNQTPLTTLTATCSPEDKDHISEFEGDYSWEVEPEILSLLHKQAQKIANKNIFKVD